MIQLSPQISSSGEAGKTLAPEQTSLKKGKLGVFAKLLEGLTGKTKSAAGEGRGTSPAGSSTREASRIAEKANAKERKKSPALAGGEVSKTETALGLLGGSPSPRLQNQQVPSAEGVGKGGSLGGKTGVEGKNPLRRDLAAVSGGRESLRKNGAGEAPAVEARAGVRSLSAGEEIPGEQLVRGEEQLREELRGDVSAIEDPPAEGKERPFQGYAELASLTERAAEGESLPFTEIGRAGRSGTEKEARDDDRSGPRLSEARNGKRKGDRFQVQVRDLRAGEDLANGPVPQAVVMERHESLGDSREADITVILRNGGQESEQRSSAGILSAPGRAFEDLLARELHQNLNGDIVRQASIILKDGGEGAVRLSLRPESLGNVKIRLEMAENKITGHIVVESNEALRAFEREIQSLEQAFRESGFESATLDMSLASGNGGENGRWRGGEAPNPYSERLAASLYDTATETAGLPGLVSLSAAEPGREAVNMLV